MKLSILFLLEHLNIEGTIFCSNSLETLLERPVYCEDSQFFEEPFLILAANKLRGVEKIKKVACIFCVGTPDECYKDFQGVLICFSGEKTAAALFQAVQAIFNEYDLYEYDLCQGLIHQKGLQTLVDIFEKMFGNPVFMIDMNFHFLALSPLMYTCQETADHLPDEQGNLPLDIVNAVKFDLNFKKILEYQTAFYFNNKNIPMQDLCFNIFHKKIVVARILVVYVKPLMRKSDRFLMDQFGQYASLFYEQFESNHKEETLSLRNTLIQLLEGSHIPDYSLEKSLKRYGFEAKDSFLLYFIQLGEDDRRSSTAVFLCKKFTALFSEVYAFAYLDNVFLLLDLSRVVTSREELFAQLSFAFRDSMLKTGKSREFQDLRKIKEFYIQAVAALEFGLQRNPTIWNHDFEEYAFEYFRNFCTHAAPMETLCSSAVLRLLAYDKKQNTSYVETLYTYFHCKFNVSKAAKEIFIHRTTFIERLERIRHIKNDWETYFTKLLINRG